MIGQIYPTELQLNKANSSDTEAPFLDLNLSITNGIVFPKIYDKRDDFSTINRLFIRNRLVDQNKHLFSVFQIHV